MSEKNSQSGSVSRALKNLMEMPQGIIGRNIRVELKGNSEALIDGCSGIREYDEKGIRIFGGGADVKFTGRNLVITSLSADQLMIEGIIDSLEFI